jgi:hypothetical protein
MYCGGTKKGSPNFDEPKVRTLLCERFVAKRSPNILCPSPNAVKAVRGRMQTDYVHDAPELRKPNKYGAGGAG